MAIGKPAKAINFGSLYKPEDDQPDGASDGDGFAMDGDAVNEALARAFNKNS
jgi:hypothetical protein